ncbi:hypothetical protein ABPG74_001023 [Tetrahymena malaccensis]
MSTIQLRIRGPKGQKVISSLRNDSTFLALKEQIASLNETNQESLVLKMGFPPQVITGQDNQTLEQLSISSGSTIIAEVDLKKVQVPINKEIPNQQVPNQDGLVMIRKVIPADNNCLFSSVIYALERNKPQQSTKPIDLRKYIASVILKPNSEYDEVVLEKSKSEYATWIQQETSWGGAIEVKILSEKYNVEMVVINIQTGKAEHFGQDLKTNDRIFLLYDGIHYDILCRNISEDMPEEYNVCVFEKNDMYAYEGCLVLAKQFKEKKQFTDVSSFTLQCGICLKGFTGQAEALKHGQSTGHMNFQEVKK